jgi:hypothetical protein
MTAVILIEVLRLDKTLPTQVDASRRRFVGRLGPWLATSHGCHVTEASFHFTLNNLEYHE